MPAKTLVIGLDSYEPRLLRTWAESGALPTFRALLETTLYGPVGSPTNLYAGTVWASFGTGVSPARHRRFFRRQAPRGAYLDTDFLPTSIAVAPFWTGLSAAGKRVAIIDVPHCAVSRNLNGIHLVDWSPHEPDFDVPQSYPADLVQTLTRDLGLPARLSCDAIDHTASGYAAFTRGLAERVRNKTALSLRCLQQQTWDLLITVFGEAHCVGHQCWHVHDAGHPRHDRRVAMQVANPLLTIYKALDTAVAELLAAAGPTTTVIVLASHGMGPLYSESVVLDDILRCLEATSSPHGTWYQRMKRAWYTMPPAVRRLPLTHRLRQRVAPSLHANMLVPDRMQRRCFAIPNNPHAGAIRINLVGREPSGRVRPGAEYRAFCERLRDELQQLVNPMTGNSAVREVTIVPDAYAGPFVDELPDLLVEWARTEPVAALASPRLGTFTLPTLRGRSGDHRCDGLFFARGPGIGHGVRAETVSIMDFAPTLGARLGVRLDGLDGHVIPELAGGLESWLEAAPL